MCCRLEICSHKDVGVTVPVLPDPPVFNAANLSSFIMNKSTHCSEGRFRCFWHVDDSDDYHGDDNLMTIVMKKKMMMTVVMA